MGFRVVQHAILAAERVFMYRSYFGQKKLLSVTREKTMLVCKSGKILYAKLNLKAKKENKEKEEEENEEKKEK